MTDWQPIETAPCGEAVLAFFPAQSVKSFRLTGYLGPRDDMPPADDPRWREEFQHTDGGTFVCVQWEGDEPWELVGCDDSHYWPTGDPTHWMPLPKAPTA
jgi:hypothetical protein